MITQSDGSDSREKLGRFIGGWNRASRLKMSFVNTKVEKENYRNRKTHFDLLPFGNTSRLV